MDLGCPLLRGSSVRRLRRRAATVKNLVKVYVLEVKIKKQIANILFEQKMALFYFLRKKHMIKA